MTVTALYASTNIVPGAAVLGGGLNVFGTYDDTSITRPLFDLSRIGSQYTSPGGAVYDVPANALLNARQTTSGQSHVWESQEDFSRYFAARTQISGSGLFFSAEFEANYETVQQRRSDYVFGMFEARITSWELRLMNQSAADLLPSVAGDPDFADLPSTYDDSTDHKFFQFFHKFGTHYVDAVTVGGRMFYSSAVSRTYSSDSTVIHARLAAEYNGVFAHGSAEAQADFQSADQRWFQSRQARVSTIGGSSDILAAVIPSFGVNNNGPFETWIHSIDGAPVVIDFVLKPIDLLFSGAQAQAVRTAFARYAGSRLSIESSQPFSSINLTGKPVPQVPAPRAGSWGWQVAVVDREGLGVVFSGIWDQVVNEKGVADRVAEGLAPYVGDRRYVVGVATFNMWGPAYPTQRLYDTLRALGAGPGLEQWMTGHSGTSPVEQVTYALIGAGGAGPNNPVSERFNYGRTPQAVLANAFFIPTQGDDFDVVGG